MTLIVLPSFSTAEEALDWLDARGVVVRVCLLRGPDGLLRGSALIRARS